MLFRENKPFSESASMRVTTRIIQALRAMNPASRWLRAKQPARSVLCVGMIRSCSTWQYNVACKLLERAGVGQGLGFMSGDQFAAWKQANSAAEGWVALKYHDPQSAYFQALQAGSALGLYSYRDLRDVFYSEMLKYGYPFERCLENIGIAIESDRLWTAQPNLLIQRYEEIVAAPAKAVQQIANHLGIGLRSQEAAEIADAFSLAANKERALSLKVKLQEEGVDLSRLENKYLYDEKTLLHWNHIGSASTGYWRTLATSQQRAEMAKRCGKWLIERGYEKDFAWVSEGIDEAVAVA